MVNNEIPKEVIVYITDFMSNEDFMKNICLLFRSPRLEKRREVIIKLQSKTNLKKYLMNVDDILYDTYFVSSSKLLKDVIKCIVESIFDSRINKRLKNTNTNHMKQMQYKRVSKMELFRPFNWTMTHPVKILENIDLCPVYRTTKFNRRFLMRKYKTVAALIY